MDAKRAQASVREAYGEVVWFGRRGAGVKFLGSKLLRGDGGKRAVLRGEHEVSRKAIAQGRPECCRCPVCSCAVLFAQIARGTAGAASTQPSLRPQIEGGKFIQQTSDATCREIAKLYPPSLPPPEEAAEQPPRRARRPVRNPPSRAWNPDPEPRNRPACLDFRQSDFPLVT
jgi:hypothetical protein